MTGQELKALRKKHGYTQKTLAEELNLRRESITEWETEVRPMGNITQKMFIFFFELKKIKNNQK